MSNPVTEHPPASAYEATLLDCFWKVARPLLGQSGKLNRLNHLHALAQDTLRHDAIGSHRRRLGVA
jgi:hypothetical protein